MEAQKEKNKNFTFMYLERQIASQYYSINQKK